jgi:hypothetical protein
MDALFKNIFYAGQHNLFYLRFSYKYHKFISTYPQTSPMWSDVGSHEVRQDENEFSIHAKRHTFVLCQVL